MNIAELLNKYAKQGDKLYSPLYGEVIYEFADEFIFTHTHEGKRFAFFKNGRQLGYDECMLFPNENQRDWEKWAEEQEVEKKDLKKDDYIKVDYDNGVIRLGKIVRICKSTIVVNPLYKEDKYELSVFKDKTNYKIINKWSADMLKTGQLVLVREDNKSVWVLSIYSNYIDNEPTKYPFRCVNYATYAQCIPYNFETKELIGTTDKPNKFYRF